MTSPTRSGRCWPRCCPRRLSGADRADTAYEAWSTGCATAPGPAAQGARIDTALVEDLRPVPLLAGHRGLGAPGARAHSRSGDHPGTRPKRCGTRCQWTRPLAEPTCMPQVPVATAPGWWTVGRVIMPQDAPERGSPRSTPPLMPGAGCSPAC